MGRYWSPFGNYAKTRSSRILRSGKVRQATQQGKVRWQENGLLDVGRKGKYLKKIDLNSKSTLLKLPAEVRNKIWGYVLGGNTIFAELAGPLMHTIPWRRKKALCLIQTCRQIYAEASLMYFRYNTFVFYSRSQLSCFLSSRLPVQRDVMTSIVLWPYHERRRQEDGRYLDFLGPSTFFGGNAYEALARRLSRLWLTRELEIMRMDALIEGLEDTNLCEKRHAVIEIVPETEFEAKKASQNAQQQARDMLDDWSMRRIISESLGFTRHPGIRPGFT